MLDINFGDFPELISERLLLRRLGNTDAEHLFKLRTDPLSMQYLDRKPMETIEEAIDLINTIEKNFVENNGITWAIALLSAPAILIGTIGFWKITKEHHRAEIGYMLSSEYFRKGYATEAINRVNEYGFKHLKFHSIEANINPDNDGSEAVLLKTGFVKEAHFKENYYFDGLFKDSAIYSLLNNKK